MEIFNNNNVFGKTISTSNSFSKIFNKNKYIMDYAMDNLNRSCFLYHHRDYLWFIVNRQDSLLSRRHKREKKRCWALTFDRIFRLRSCGKLHRLLT